MESGSGNKASKASRGLAHFSLLSKKSAHPVGDSCCCDRTANEDNGRKGRVALDTEGPSPW